MKLVFYRAEVLGSIPKSTITESVYARKRPYFVVLHGPVLRSYMTVTVYGDIRRKTEIVNDRIFTVHGRKRPYFSVNGGDLNVYGT